MPEMMNAQPMLDHLKVAAPCSARWEDMEGDDRARFCGQCRKHVFNFSAMTRGEPETLVREKVGRLCGRFYRRRDGRVLTTDCPVGLERRRNRLARLCGLLFATGLLSLGSRVALRSEEQPRTDRSPFFEQLDELVYQAKVKIGIVQPTFVMGMICPRPAPPPSPPAPPAPPNSIND